MVLIIFIKIQFTSGQNLAYACQDGRVIIIKTENGEKLHSINSKTTSIGGWNLNGITWNFYTYIENIDEINPLKKNSLLDKLIPQISPHIFSDK